MNTHKKVITNYIYSKGYSEKKIKNAVVSDDEVLLEKFEIELTDILFEI